MKQLFVDKVMVKLASNFSTNQQRLIRDVLFTELAEYEMKSIKNELIIYKGDDDQYINMFLVSKKIDGLSDTSIHNYRNYLNKELHRYIKNKSCIEYTKEDLKMHFARRMIDNPNMKTVSLNNERRVFSTFFAWLSDNDYITKNPMRTINKIKEQKVKKKAFSEEDAEKMRRILEQDIHAANSKKSKIKIEKAYRNLALFELLLCSGCRANEICTALEDDLDLDKREFKVLGKGNKERICYFNVRTKMAIEDYLKVRRFEEEGRTIFYKAKNTNQYNETKNNHLPHSLTVSGLEIFVRNLGKRAGVENAHPHRFRRTCATWALNRGMPIEEVQTMLGHEDIGTTTIYAMVQEKKVKAHHDQYICKGGKIWKQ